MPRNLRLSLFLVPALLAPRAEARQEPELRACWLTQYAYLGRSEAQLRDLAQNIRGGGMNTVYVAMYAGARTLWPSQAYAQAGGLWTSTLVDYAELLTRVLREEGLNVGAWFEYGLAVGPANHPLALAHPDWLARDQSGSAVTGENGGFVFLSPGHPQARQLIVDMARELIENYDFDDIQLDRIRWGRKSSGREYGYEDATANLYLTQTGQSPPSNVNQPAWVAFREGLVDSLMVECAAAVRASKPTTVVSAAPTGSYGITQHMQRWSTWLDQGSVDLIMPQMYMTSLGAFQNEFNFHLSEAAGHLEKLGVGYRASDPSDAFLVADQLEYARAAEVPHGCLWVYHYYTSVPAIQDEIDLLPQAGQPWESEAENPFVSPRDIRLVMDDDQGFPAYTTTGPWFPSAQPDYFRFASDVVDGSLPATASFHSSIPRTGSYQVDVWYTASSNRSPAAPYQVHHYGGSTTVPVDQRSDGGQWVPLGQFVFAAGDSAMRVGLSNAGSPAGEFISSDAVRLTHAADGESTCTTAPNSHGPGARIGFEGSTSLGANDLVVRVEGGVPAAFGVLFYGAVSAQAVPFGDGHLCVSGATYRVNPVEAFDASGTVRRPLDTSQGPLGAGPGAALPGTSWTFQFWYRDPAAGGAGFNLSDALLLDFRL